MNKEQKDKATAICARAKRRAQLLAKDINALAKLGAIPELVCPLYTLEDGIKQGTDAGVNNMSGQPRKPDEYFMRSLKARIYWETKVIEETYYGNSLSERLRQTGMDS